MSLQPLGILGHLWDPSSLALLEDPSFLGALDDQMQGLLAFLSDQALRVTQESLGAQQVRTPFHLQNLDLPCDHENQGNLGFLIVLVFQGGLWVHRNTSAQEHLWDLEIPLDLEAHQNPEGLACQGRSRYKE